MNVNEFFSGLIDSDCELKNIAFNENKQDFLNSINNFTSKLAIAVSSSFFNENLVHLSEISNINNLQSIISLPIFHENSNVILIVLNSQKGSDDFVLIDESDSLIHKNDDENWFFIEDNIAFELSNSINNLEECENALKLKIADVFINQEIPETEEEDEYSDFLTIKRTKQHVPKRKVITDVLLDEILDLKESSSSIMEKNNEINSINELMYFKKRQNPENYLNKNNKPLLNGEVVFRKLSKICDLKNIKDKNDEDTLLIATCKLCSNKLAYYNYDVEDFNDEVYIEISNLSENVLMEYLYEYFNSNNGRDELLYYSKGNNYIRAEFIKSIKIPIPSIEEQKEIVKASRESREFFKTVDLLKNEFNSNIFDYKHVLDSIRDLKGDIEFDDETNEITTLSRSWRHAFQGLIWPLAISYLSATKGGFEIVEKKDNYLRLFEFIAAFNTIILLSGLPDDLYKKNFDDIWDSPKGLNDYKQMTFGNWYYLSKSLAEVYRNNNFSSKLDESLFKKITSNKLLDILKKALDFRNEDSHSSQQNAYEAKEVVDILDNYLEDIFDILEEYSNYKLVYTTGDLNASREGLNHNVILLNGPCAQPIYDNLIVDSMLMSNSLYLYNPKNNKKLLIKENLMKFVPVDKNRKRWALFIYYSCDRNEFNAYYKCFQSNEKDLKQSITSFKRDILNYN